MSREDCASIGLTFRFQVMVLQKVRARLRESEKGFLSIEMSSVSPFSFYCPCLFWVPV